MVNLSKQNYQRFFGFSLAEIFNVYQDEYCTLYDNNDNVAGYREAVDMFDSHILSSDEYKPLLKAFWTYYHDIISSDREGAAFAFALDTLRII